MALRPDNESLYKTFRGFMKQCLIKNRSLLWPEDNYWTIENLYTVKKRLIDSPILGRDLSFDEKLEQQMSGATQAEWGIICDTFFIYFLPSTFITFDKKVNDISWAAKMGGLKAPQEDANIWGAQKNGFTRTSLRYHSKYSQFWLILLFAIYVKEHEDPNSIINKHQAMQHALDMILENIQNRVDRAYDIRHAMLYMAFPTEFERIISTRDKKRIVEAYSDKIDELLPSDLDETIRLIRAALSETHDKPDRPFDWYQDLKSQWRPKGDAPPDTVIETESGPVTVPSEEKNTNLPVETTADVTAHTEIQWLLLKLGSDMGLDLWVAKNDKNKEVAGQRFSDLPQLKNELPLNFDAVTNKTIELIDVLWMKGNAILAAFEIESTTSIYSGILRMADLIAMQPNLNIPLYIVAPEERRQKVISEVNRPVFSRLSPAMYDICKYISFSALKKQYAQISTVIKYLKPDFLDGFAESCEIIGDEQ